ncbi:hypothetical protein BDQ17DRAFT_673700 [Cyathus striatus]|nr:hypothetical protein BDQ17DRAFT_673700 [Cyathus striatus]
MDNVIYYGIAFLLYLCAGIVWTVKPIFNCQIAGSIMLLVSIVVGCRLILHLSEVYERNVSGHLNVWSSDICVTSP